MPSTMANSGPNIHVQHVVLDITEMQMNIKFVVIGSTESVFL